MSSIHVSDDTLTVRMAPLTKLAGLLRDQRIPLTAVTAVEVVQDGLAAARGLRAPGLALPGRRKVGTWRGGSSCAAITTTSCCSAMTTPRRWPTG
jgi:hypothetical protein